MVFESIAVDDAGAADYIEISDSQDVGASETKLLECLRAGEEICFETLVRQLGPLVLATARGS